MSAVPQIVQQALDNEFHPSAGDRTQYALLWELNAIRAALVSLCEAVVVLTKEEDKRGPGRPRKEL